MHRTTSRLNVTVENEELISDNLSNWLEIFHIGQTTSHDDTLRAIHEFLFFRQPRVFLRENVRSPSISKTHRGGPRKFA